MDEKLTKKILDRQKANYEILEILKEWVDRHQELRFGQILSCANVIQYDYSNQNVSVIDPFFNESVDMLAIIKRPNK